MCVMSRTRPRDRVLSVPFARRPSAKPRRLPPTVPRVRIPFGFSAISKTSWRCRQSAANPSLLNSLLNREKTGNFREFSQFGEISSGIRSSIQQVSHEFPKNRNREFWRHIRDFSRDIRETHLRIGVCFNSLAAGSNPGLDATFTELR